MLDNFDFGAELSEEVNHIKRWPTEGNRVALIDADLLPHIVCYAIDTITQLKAENRVESGDCPSLKDTPEFMVVAEKMCMVYNDWVKRAGCDAAIPYLTKSETNFRVGLAFSKKYKGQRKEKPFFFAELKQFFMDELGGVLSETDEADDLISIEAWRRNQQFVDAGVVLGSGSHKELCDFVIVSIDKDSRITPGAHYDPDTRRHTFGDYLGWFEPEWKPDGKLKKLRGCGQKFFYSQLIAGDATDNYPGIPRKGIVLAYELLEGCKSEKELFEAVLGAYKDKYGTGPTPQPNYRGGTRSLRAIDLMHEQGRLAHMSRYPGDIWRKDKSPIIWGDEEGLWSQ